MQDFIKTIIKQAGALALENFDKKVYSWEKAKNDVVTEADMEVNDFLVKKIHEKYPSHKIHTEENKIDVDGDIYEWVIDPIDGTRNYMSGIPLWCNMIAVLKNDELYLAAIYSPFDNKLFFAEAGKGAYCNDKQIKIKDKKPTDNLFGYFYSSHRGLDPDRFVKGWLEVVKNERMSWRRMGTMLATCYIAQGNFDFFINNRLYDHDCLAPKLICEEAGAIVSAVDGKPWKRGTREFIVAVPGIHEEIMKYLN